MTKINIQNYIDAILSLNLFHSFSKKQLLHLFYGSKFEIIQYGKEQIVHLQNEICNTMDIILEGRVSVQKISNEGNILKISVFSDGDILGANLLFASKNSYPMTIVSESKSVILHIYKDLVLKLSQKDASFTAGLLTVISDKTVVLTDKINAISLKTVRQRIIDFLQYEYYLQKSNTLRLDISKKELAERFGIQRTSLSRELNKMKKEGLLEYDARTITIKRAEIFNCN